ncbi:Arm DNA-binding domain-containing protein [Ureibacillus sp. FSL K6-0165]|uniref:Arm DNA-binding domain-containing protein n=1 Tax=Ureibacillus sp. FSL K6-0165 TaxID=2954606 RepID=UPI0030FACA25
MYIGVVPLTNKEIKTTRSKFKTKKEAELALARMKLEIANGIYRKAKAETYQDIYNLWIKNYENTVEESTFVNRRNLSKSYITCHVGI